MAIGVTFGGTTWTVNNATTVTVTMSQVATRLVVVVAACKASTITSVDMSLSSAGWTRAQFADGTTPAGNGTGSVCQAVFWKVLTSTETNPVLTWGGSQTAAPGMFQYFSFNKAASEEWIDPVVLQAATTNATSISVAMGSDPGLRPGDLCLAIHTTRDDSAITVPTFTASGTTLGTAVDLGTHTVTATSNDMAAAGARRFVTAGTSSAAPVVTGTQAAAETGVTTFIRLRAAFVPATTALGITSYEPTITVAPAAGGNQTVTPTTAALVITENTPTVTVSNNQRVTPTTKALTSATYAPTVRLGTVITVPTAGGAGYAAAVTASSPLAYYRMGEASGSVLDSIGSAHGTVTGTVTRDVTGLISAGAGDDGAISFAGSGYFEAPFPASIGNVFSIELWLNKPAGSGWTTFFSSSDIAFSTNLTSHELYAYLEVSSVFSIQAQSGTFDLTAGVHHVVWTRSGHSSVFAMNKLYVDGVDISQNTGLNGVANPDTATTFRVGEYIDGSESFLGTIDELALYNTALSAADVLAHYTAGITSGGLRLTTYAPTIRQGIGVIPTTRALVATTYAPTVTPSNHQRVTPTTATVVLAKYAPTVTASAAQTLIPGTAAITTTKYAPTVTAHQHVTVTPTTAALADTQYAPTVTVSNHQRVTPTTASLVVTKYAPAARTPALVTPTTKSLALTKFAPTVRTPQTLTPAVKALTTTKFAPTITNPQRYVPATAALVATRYAPSVSSSAASTIVVPNATLTITRHIPTVSATAHLAVTPPAATLTSVKFAPTVSSTAHQTVTPTTKALTVTRYAPTVDVSSATGVVPATKALVLTRYAPTVSFTAHVSVTPSTKVLQLTKFAPAARVANRATPASKALVLTTPAPIVTPTLNTLVRPAPFVLTITRYPAILGASGHQYPEPLPASLLLTGLVPSVEIHSNTPLPEFIYGFAVVATGDSAGVGTAQGGATVTASEGGSTAVSMTGPSARVSIR